MKALDSKKLAPTDEQLLAIEKLRANWSEVGPPMSVIGTQVRGTNTCAFAVQCFYRSGHSMWICIEPDGYAHS